MAVQNFVDWFIVGLRWAHIVAILGWVGTSLYFMWLESKLRSPDPTRENVLGEAWMGHGGGFYIVEKRLIAAGQVPSPVYWFRVEAAITWVTGFLLLVFLYYWTGGVDLVDPEASVIGPQAAVGLAVALLVVGWIIYDALWVSQLADRTTLANIVSLALLFAVVYLLCKLFTGRAAVIHVGAIMGTNMVANVWTRIIPAQEEAVAATTAGRQRNAVLATRARRRAIHNTYLTLPVIFTMIATHAPGTYSHPLNWLILSLLIVVGMAARHLLIIYDQRGVLDCNAFPVTKKELTRIVTDIQADDRLTHVELPPAYAQQLVEESYRRNLSSGTPVPRDFQGLRDLIGMPNVLWEQRPIYHLVRPEEVRGQPAWLSLSGQLLEVKEFQGWHLPPEALQKYREEVKRTAESPIIVSQALQQERVEAVQKRTLREIFAPNICVLYRARLEEMAYLLWQTKRPDEAKRALASALALQGEEVDPAEHPFLRALFTRSVEVAEALEQQDTGRVTVATPRLWTP